MKMFSVALVFFAFYGCSKKSDDIVTIEKQKPSDNYIYFELSSSDSLGHLKDGKYIMQLDHSEVTEGGILWKKLILINSTSQ